jgi:hypothetical protein
MSALDWPKCPGGESVPDSVGGAWVFKGTRLPVATVTDRRIRYQQNLKARRTALWR